MSRPEDVPSSAERAVRAAYDALPHLVWVAAAESPAIWANRAWGELTGGAAGDLPRERLLERLHPDDVVAIDAALAEPAASPPRTFDLRIRRRDGSWHRFLAHAVAGAGALAGSTVLTAFDVENLKADEAAHRSAFALSGFGHVAVSPDGQYERVSESFASMLGYSVGELVGMRVEDVTHPDDREVSRTQIRRLFSGEVTELHLEKRYIRKDGAVVWGVVAAALVRDAAGNPVQTTAIVRNVTARKAAEEAVRERESMLDQALRTASMCAYVWDLETDSVKLVGDGQAGSASRVAVMPARDYLARIDERDRERLHRDFERARHEGGTLRCEYRVRDAEGRTRWMRDLGSFVTDQNGRTVRLYGAVIDVTEEKTREAKLRIRQREFENLIENAPDIISRVDPAGRYLYVNRAAERNPAGASREAFLGRTARELGADPETAAVIEAAHARASETRSEQRAQYSGSASFDNRYYEMRIVPEFNDDGELESFLRVTRDITALHEAERAAREGEERFRAIAEALPQIIWTARPDGSVDYYNQRWAEYTGIPVEGGHGASWSPVVHPDEERRTVDTWMAAVWSGQPYRIEHRLRRRDGSYRWHLSLGVPLRDSDGTIVKWFGSATDINDAREARDALRESERRFRETVECLPQLIWTMTPDGACDYLSPQWTSFTGMPAGQQPGAGWLDAVHPDDREGVVSAWRDAVQAHAGFRTECRLRSASGEYRWFQMTAVPLRDDEGQVTKWFGTNTDVQHIKQIEEALRRSESKFRRLAEANLIAVFFTTEEGAVVDANDAFLEMVQYTREDLREGRIRWSDMTPPEYRDLDARRVDEAHRKGASTPYEKEYIRKDGSRVPVLIGFALLEGSSADYVAFALDLTDQNLAHRREQAARAEAERANRAKDEFLATLSHELRTPMTSILGWTSMLATGMVDAQTFPLAVRSVDESARLQARLIDDLLDISRITTGKLHLEMQPLNLVATVGSAIESFRGDARARKVDLRVTVHEPEVMVLGDGKRVRQVVGNLVANAIKFTGEGGRIEVTVFQNDGEARVTVRDTGSGISREFLPRVFDRFAQQESAQKRAYGGLGLGLAIVRQLVELHGGRVEAESEGLGKGSLFTVVLPRHVTPQPVRGDAGREVAIAVPRLDDVRILIVDDEPHMRIFLQAVLLTAGATVIAVSSVSEALGSAERDKPAVIVSDVAMPGEDGFALISELRLREASSGRRIPAIAVSALGFDDDRKRILAAGFDEYLSKPVEPAALLRAVAALAREATR